jgi:hypothetical protein
LPRRGFGAYGTALARDGQRMKVFWFFFSKKNRFLLLFYNHDKSGGSPEKFSHLAN